MRDRDEARRGRKEVGGGGKFSVDSSLQGISSNLLWKQNVGSNVNVILTRRTCSLVHVSGSKRQALEN